MQPAEVLCPNCGAEPGDPCSGTHTFHAERVDAAEVTYAHNARKDVKKAPSAAVNDSPFEKRQSDR